MDACLDSLRSGSDQDATRHRSTRLRRAYQTVGMDPKDWLTGSAWSYLIMCGSIAGSAVFPPLPSELTLVTAMSMAVEGELRVTLVALACGTGALLGDAVAYTVGGLARGSGGPRGPLRVRQALAWVEGRDRIWVAGLIVVSRFVPGGTTAVGLAAGATKFPIPTFLALALTGASLWTSYGYGLARVGSQLFPNSPLLSTGLAIISVLAFTGVVKLVRPRLVDQDSS